MEQSDQNCPAVSVYSISALLWAAALEEDVGGSCPKQSLWTRKGSGCWWKWWDGQQQWHTQPTLRPGARPKLCTPSISSPPHPCPLTCHPGTQALSRWVGECRTDVRVRHTLSVCVSSNLLLKAATQPHGWAGHTKPYTWFTCICEPFSTLHCQQVLLRPSEYFPPKSSDVLKSFTPSLKSRLKSLPSNLKSSLKSLQNTFKSGSQQ